MNILIIKTSSMGDVIHTLPALTDAVKAYPAISFDWVVEESFADIPRWHPQVKKVIPIAWRRWRKHLWSQTTRDEMRAFGQMLRATPYDLIIDAQGLVKSACMSILAKGKRAGLDWRSAREPVAAWAYHKTCSVNFYQHAIQRMRSIFSQLLDYPLPDSLPAYGIDREQFLQPRGQHYVVFLHGTTWDTKLWPTEHWLALAKRAGQQGLAVKLLWGNAHEQARAEYLAAHSSNITVLPRQTLQESARVLANARAVVAVDTGFAHLAAALDVPGVSLYGPTNPAYSGVLGRQQIALAAQFPCAPCLKRKCSFPRQHPSQPACFAELPAEKVWLSVEKLLSL